jgi:DnaJ-class molecular chaperone
MTEEQKEILITCCKCHGQGVYDVAVYNESGEIIGWNPTLCELCNGTGKITLEFYEMIQSHAREMQK